MVRRVLAGFSAGGGPVRLSILFLDLIHHGCHPRTPRHVADPTLFGFLLLAQGFAFRLVPFDIQLEHGFYACGTQPFLDKRSSFSCAQTIGPRTGR